MYSACCQRNNNAPGYQLELSLYFFHLQMCTCTLVDVLVCSVTVYFYELCHISTSPEGMQNTKK